MENHLTGNNSQGTAQNNKELMKIVIEFYEENNIPYQMIQGYPIHIDPRNSIQLKCDTCHRIYKLPSSMYYATLIKADSIGQLEYITLECVYCKIGEMISIDFINKK